MLVLAIPWSGARASHRAAKASSASNSTVHRKPAAAHQQHVEVVRQPTGALSAASREVSEEGRRWTQKIHTPSSQPYLRLAAQLTLQLTLPAAAVAAAVEQHCNGRRQGGTAGAGRSSVQPGTVMM